jgi:hypothetical protein
MPARLRRTACETAVTASAWPTIRACISSSSFSRRSFSSAVSWETGIPVRRETMSAMSDAVTDTTPFTPLLDARELALQLGDLPLQLRRLLEILGGDGLVLLAPQLGSRSSRLTTSADREALRSRTRAPAWSARTLMSTPTASPTSRAMTGPAACRTTMRMR